MKRFLFNAVIISGIIVSISSCTKNDDLDLGVKPYTVPTTYAFSNVNFTKASQRIKMTVQLDNYLKTANTGSGVVPLDQAKVTNMFNNTNSAFADASLNSSGLSIKDITSDASLYKSFADSILLYNSGTAATAGTGGFVPRTPNKIIVGPRGLEYGQAFLKGTMGALFFKEAIKILTNVKTISAADTLAAQAQWDEAFGYLSVPLNYDSAVVYANTDPNRPLLWGGYLAERGKGIQAGGTIFNAFLKGRAAIGGYDVTVRNQQADIIMAKWEQLAAAAALNYVTSPTASSSIGNYGSQLHALSEAFGFVQSFKYRPEGSKLTAANFQALNAILNKDFYVLLNQPGFTDLVAAQNILKTAYGL
ncbi:MAG: DUF4856 domain-containing protein [Chitinophagaceae bacterium]|nr:DUF4856 domain-containing protein [Chitinophagaceae bacterium]